VAFLFSQKIQPEVYNKLYLCKLILKHLKHLMNKFFTLITIIVLPLSAYCWGYQGHYKISYSASLSFTGEMTPFNAWTATLAEYASYADERKEWDPSESARHYIDIDNYEVFVNTGRIPQTIDSVIDIYGWTFVYDQGILPWATLNTYDSLVSCFVRNDMARAVLFAADLGHYVADGHMPLHITRNYNGQYTGNSGIHSRYESTMINNYISQIVYDGEPVELITDVDQYVFDYLYQNYTFVDSVIAADDYAKSISGNYNSSAYKQALWLKSKSFTIHLFKEASHTLAELIYAAWVEAGQPPLSSASISETGNEKTSFGIQVFPNPVMDMAEVYCVLPGNEYVTLTLTNLSGKNVSVLFQGMLTKGTHSIKWNPVDTSKGVYLISLSGTHSATCSRRIILF